MKLLPLACFPRCASALVSCGLVAGLLTVGFEWAHYEHLFFWRGLASWDTLILGWLIAAKSLWLFAPLVVAVGLLRSAGWTRTSQVLLAAGIATVSFWLMIDLRVQEATGTHLLGYLSFVAGHKTWRWVGGGHLIDVGSVAMLLGFALALGMTALACVALGGWLSRRWPALDGTWAQRGAAGAYLAACVGVLFLAPSTQDPLMLTRLGQALPVPAHPILTAAAPADHEIFRQDFERVANRALRTFHPLIKAGQPVDNEIRLTATSRPNVIILVLESLRADAISPENTPRLERWAQKGLRLQSHYAGSNSSHLGMFGLLYGRTPLVYHSTLDRDVPPQLPTTFRNSGYECSYVTTTAADWVKRDRFINDRVFDRVIKSQGDRTILRGAVPDILRQAGDRPQLVVAFLTSTHFNYAYPAHFEKHVPVVPEDCRLATMPSPEDRRKLHNRYRNSLAYMDEEVSNLIETLDPSRNLVVVTGGNGESFGEDSSMFHARKGSDAQMRVPFLMVGPNVPERAVTHLTRHVDVLPTLLHAVDGRAVPVAHAHGKDVLAPGFANQHLVLFPSNLGESGNGLVLIRGEKRLRVRCWFDRPVVKAEGCIDEHDRWHDVRLPHLDETRDWHKVLLEELHRLAF